MHHHNQQNSNQLLHSQAQQQMQQTASKNPAQYQNKNTGNNNSETPFVEFESEDIAAINTGGKSTQTKKINDFTDLKSFKNAQKQIKAAQGCSTVDQVSSSNTNLQPGSISSITSQNNATSTSLPQAGVVSTTSKKNQGVASQNMQNLINSEGPMIMGLPDFVHHSTQNMVMVGKTNPTSMREKFKMENPGKKILTPRGGGQHSGNGGGISSNNTSTKGGLHHNHHHHHNAQQAAMSGNLMQRQNFHEIDAYSSEQVSGRGGAGTTGTLSTKHHESISGFSGSATTTKGKNGGNGKRQGIMTTTLSEIDKKHMGLPSSGGHSNNNHGNATTSSKKHHIAGQAATCNSSSKNSAGRGAGGSIDLLSGVTSLSQIKSKSIHGQKISEVTVQSNQVLKHGGSLHGGTTTNTNTGNNGNHQQTPSFNSTTMTSKQQFSLNSNKQGGSLLTAMIQTPQKFRVKNSSHQSAKKGSMLKGQNHAQSMGPMADNSCSTSVKNNHHRGNQQAHGGSSTIYNQRDSFENQRLVTAAKSQPGSSGGTANRKGQQLLSTNLSKVTSEKKLTGVAGSTISDAASHISPRDTTAHHSHSKADSKNSQGSKLQPGGKNSTTSKKVPHPQHISQIQNVTTNNHQTSSNYMNEYLVESQKNMKQLQKHHQQQHSSSQFQTQTTSHASLVFSQREPIQLMSTTTVMPQSTLHGGGSQTTKNAQQQQQRQTMQNLSSTATTAFDLKKKKPSQASMRQLQQVEVVHHHQNHHNPHFQKQNVNVVSKTKASRRQGGSQSITQQPQVLDNSHVHVQQQHISNKIHGSAGTATAANYTPVELETFHQTISEQHNKSDLQEGAAHVGGKSGGSSSGALNNADDRRNIINNNINEKNLFYKVQDATLCQDQTTEQEMIEYFEDDNFEPPMSAKKSSKQATGSNHQKAQNNSKKYVLAADDRDSCVYNSIDHDNEVIDDEELVDEDIKLNRFYFARDNDTDGVPVIAELVEDEDIFRKPSSPIHQAEGIIEHENDDLQQENSGAATLLEDIDDGYIEHRNADATNNHHQFSINALSGQKTEIFNNERQNAKLFKNNKVGERTQQVKSLLQPSQSNEMDKFIYNARSGLPNQNFNFAKNQTQNQANQQSHHQQHQRPTSTKQGQKTLTCWTGSLAQANYTSSTKHLGGVTSAKNQNARSIVGGSFNNTVSFQKVGLGAQYNKTSQRTVKGGSNNANSTTASGAKIGGGGGSLSHPKNQSQQAQKDIYKVQGGGASGAITAAKKKNSAQNSHASMQQQHPQHQSELVANKVTSSSFETRPGSQSMSYIPPRRIQDQSLQLIQVPLSRAELNKQSAYHLADSQYGGGPAGSHHHKSISYCKDDVRAFNRSLQKNNSTSGNNKNLLKNQAGLAEKQTQGGGGGAGGMYQTSAAVTAGFKHVDSSNIPFKLQKTVMIPGSTSSGAQGNIDAPGDGVTSATMHVFSRSQSNQQISTTHNAAVTNTINGPGKRMTNSQSRGKQRGDHLQALHGGSNVVSPNPSNNVDSRSINKQQRGSDHQVPSSHQAGIKKGSSSQGQGQKTTSSQLQSNMTQTKLARKNQNNLKMSTMQLRDQDFKKITSQIQSQTMTNAAVNAKKKKIQFHQQQNVKGGQTSGVSNQAPASTTRLNNQPPGSIGHADQLDLPQKFIQTSKIYSPHRRSIQQVSNPNMGAYLNPIDAVTDLPQETSSNGGGGTSGTNNYTGSRKFAYSLTDKYKGGFDELCWKQPGVYSGSHVSSSDGGASYIIPSENERIESTSKRKDKAKTQAGAGGAGGVTSSKAQKSVGGSGANTSKRLSGMTASQANLNQQYAVAQQNTGNNMNMFFPDPSATSFFERKKSSMERTATGQHTVTSSQQQNIAKSRGSSKHIEQPHRMVKVSKPFASSQSKKSSLHGGQKGSNTGSKGGGLATTSIQQQMQQMQQQHQPAPIMATNPNAQKKSGSFGGGFKEPPTVEIIGTMAGGPGPRIQNSGSFTSSHNAAATTQNNSINVGFGHQIQTQQHPSTAPVSHHTTSNQAKIQLDSRCQSPEQPPRKNNALHLNSHGPGSLIANANLIKQQSPNASSNRQQDGGSLSGSFTGQQQPQHQSIGGGLHQSQILSAKNAASNKVYGAKNAAILTGTKSPGKKVNKKLSHRMQNGAGYPGGTDLSTATKKILNSNASSVGAYKTVTAAHHLSKDSSEQTSKVFKNQAGGGQTTTAQNTVLASFPHPSQNSLQSTSRTNSQQLPLEVHMQPSSQVADKQKNQNIQLLQKVHHKQITTASKGKDSGSVKKLQQTTTSNGGKSLSVLIPSAESVAQSKAILLESTTSSAQHHQMHQQPQMAPFKNGGGTMEQQRSSLGAVGGASGSATLDRGTDIRLGGGSLVIPSSSTGQQLQQVVPVTIKNNKNQHLIHHQNNAVNINNYSTTNNNRFQKDCASSVAASPLSEKRTPGAKSEQHTSQSKKQGNNQMVELASDAGKCNTDDDTTILQDAPSSSCAASSKKASFISGGKYNNAGNRPLNVIEERLESQDSAVSDPTLSPRSRHILKIQKKIKFAFLKQGAPPETQTENYKIGKVMGKGAFGKVNLAIHRLASKFVALKSINKQFLTQEQSKRKVMQEFNILRRTRHCNIVRLYESFETQQHIVFVMEVCGGGDLLTYVRRRRKLKEDTARFLFKQIITGLAYCHIKNVLHRDIKLDNILLTSQGDVKICDFGVSKLVTPGEQMTEQCGTPAYIAPEVFKNLGYEGFASDIWSAGVVLYAMLYGAVPFKASNMAELHKYVLERQPTYKEEEISSEALALLKGILEKDPKQRLTSDQILSHPWMLHKASKGKLVNVFTEQEKEGIVSEFEYYNKRERDVIVDGEHQVVPTDPFAEQMLSSAQDTELKNVSTRSIILAPFNSTRSQLVYSHEEGKMMKDMLMPRTSVKFSARVKEIDRQYELNNNADLDNGVYHQDEDEEESKDDCSPPAGSNPPRPTEERPETRARIRAHDEASIADSFNQEQLHSQLDELDEANNSINSAELDEGGRQRNETNYVSPASVRPLTSEQMQINKNQNKNDKNDLQQQQAANQNNNQKKLSEWRKLEKQMIKGDGQGSPPKQSLFNQKINEEIKGDKAIPDSGDFVLDQSYEQVQIELYDDLASGSANNSREGGSTALQVNLQKVTNAAMSGQSNQQRQTMIIDEASVTEIEKCGYPKPYIMASLNNDDLNHVTTFYYLLQTQKEY